MSSTEPTKVSSVEPSSVEAASASPTKIPSNLTKDQLRRLKRQLALESELSSAMDESENLGIEQVSLIFFIISKIVFYRVYYL